MLYAGDVTGNCVSYTKSEKSVDFSLDDGAAGFWTDMGEPAWSNEESPERLVMKHHTSHACNELSP